jgi:hypothetical protein
VTLPDSQDYEGQCACGFDDTVTLRIEGHTGFWRCPNCDTDNEVDVADLGPDPDALYERMREDW